MPRKKRWEESGIQDGFGIIRLLRWRYFLDYINQEMLDYYTYVWRGQRRDDWPLQSTLDRLIEKTNIPKPIAPYFRNDHLEKFKYAVRGRRGPNPPVIKDENEWWALGQHHGLSTPLLDWTTSPFAAAYFALISTGADQTDYRAIYALHRPSVEKKVNELIIHEEAEKRQKRARMRAEHEESGKKGGLTSLAFNAAVDALSSPVPPEVEFIIPKSDENQRLVSQGGLFSRAPIGMTVDEWVKKNFAGKNKGYTLMKLLIPHRDREEGLRMLNRMNINHLTLFPDLYGASKFCNLFAEIEKY
jgi:FRG domain